MKLAVVTPTAYLGMVAQEGLGYHLAEATRLLTDNVYLTHYERLGKLGHFIIVDNGAAEPEQERPRFSAVVAVANKVRASEIVLPDKYLDKNFTIEATIDGAKLVETWRRMIVPQGTTMKEWLDCYLSIAHELEGKFATIGVAKNYEWVCKGGRPRVLDTLVSFGAGGHATHLLGLSGKNQAGPMGVQTEVSAIARLYPWVRGLDTGAPIAWAQHHVALQEHRTHFSLDWNNAEAHVGMLFKNVKDLIRWCNGEK